MNTINLQQPLGFPLETNTLDAMQTAYSMFNSLGELAGDKTIIKGCIQTGNTISDGLIYVNGEVIEFRSGLLQTGVIIREDVIEGIFENGDSKPIYHTRYAKFGTGHSAIPWSDFKRIDPILMMMQRLAEVEKKTAIFQQDGGMLFWNKPVSEIPAGWQEVVNWRGRFPVSMDVNIPEFDTLGKEGGEIEVTLTEAQMPTHKHTGTTNSGGGHTPTGKAAGPYVGTNIGGGFDGGNNKFKDRPVTMNAVPNHTHGLNMNNKGGSQAHNNLPPCKVALFIEYIG